MTEVTTETVSGEIGDLLRGWREHRRLSQLELALEAGTTQRYISFVERGRSVPGRGVVVRIAEALEIPLRERNALLLAAGYAPAYSERGLDDPQLDPVRAALERILTGHLPYPAVLTDAAADVVSMNVAFESLIADVDPALLSPRANLCRIMLSPDGLARRVCNLPKWGRHVVDGLRRNAARNRNAELAGLIDELESMLPPQMRMPPSDHLGFAVPLRLQAEDRELVLLTTLAHFGTTTDVAVAELTLETFVPGDAATADYFAA
jgi:transcriptional regulator with XRE-family HTH domain